MAAANALNKFFLLYNGGMEYVSVVINSFWAIMENIVPVITPIIAIILVFSIVKGLLFNER